MSFTALQSLAKLVEAFYSTILNTSGIFFFYFHPFLPVKPHLCIAAREGPVPQQLG